MKKKKKNDMKIMGLFLLAAGLLLGLLFVNETMMNRERPVYDGDNTQDFKLTLVSYDQEINKGETMAAVLDITNEGRTGFMYMECGLYDRETDQGDWVPRTADLTYLPVYENCQPGEPFVQTARIRLAEGETIRNVEFNMQVPLDYGDDVALYCGTFERCWAPGVNTYQSDSVLRDITLLPPIPGDNGDADEEDADDEDADEEIILINNWFKDNSTIIIFIVLLLLFVGTYFIYKEPKKGQIQQDLGF